MLSPKNPKRGNNVEKEIQKLMTALGISYEEAKQVYFDDKEIDSGKDLFPLTAEQQQASKQARLTGTRKAPITFSKRERKPDTDKRFLIELLKNLIDENATNVEVSNIERQIDFIFHDRKFRIVLSAPRASE